MQKHLQNLGMSPLFPLRHCRDSHSPFTGTVRKVRKNLSLSTRGRVLKKTKYTKILNIFYFQLLNICISDNFSKLKFLTNSLNKTKNNLDSNFNKNFLNNFYSEQNKKYEHFFNKIKNKHIKKINNLMKKQHSPEDKLKINNEWITNLTETNIPEHIKYILSLGSKFSTNEPIIPKNIENITTNIEAGIDELNTNDKDLI